MSNAAKEGATAAVESTRPAIFAGFSSRDAQRGPALPAKTWRGRGLVFSRYRHLHQRRILAARCGAFRDVRGSASMLLRVKVHTNSKFQVATVDQELKKLMKEL